MSPMRVALVGLGSMGRNHMRVLESMPDVDLVGVFDTILQQDLKNGIQAKSLDEIIALKPDYCVIATPTNTHEELVSLLSKKKINLLIEKPISYSYESALRISNLIIENQVIATVGHVERFNSALIEAKKRILLGQIGRIYQITTRRLSPLPSRVTDVGVILDLASHDIDLTKWLVDSSYFRVCGLLNRRTDMDHEDVLIASALLKNGIVVSHIVNWLSPFKERVTVITGEKGTFVINTLNSELIFFSFGEFDVLQSHIAHFKGGKESEVTNYAFEKPEPLMVEHREFIKAIRGEKSLSVSIQDSLETIKVAEALFLSDKTGDTVEL